MAKIQHTAYYQAALSAWSKAWGSKPKAEAFARIHGLGFKPGVESLYVAMLQREGGCTEAEFTAAGGVVKASHGDLRACGPANNKRNLLVECGYFSVERLPSDSKGQRLRLTLTDAGQKRIDTIAQASQPKPRVAKSKPADAIQEPEATQLEASAS